MIAGLGTQLAHVRQTCLLQQSKWAYFSFSPDLTQIQHAKKTIATIYFIIIFCLLGKPQNCLSMTSLCEIYFSFLQFSFFFIQLKHFI